MATLSGIGAQQFHVTYFVQD